jgi:anti-sigma regulatory factor (Ser/Thr protein kinase)
MPASVRDGDSGFLHEAFFYSGDEEFAAGTLPFIREGLDASEPVLVALDRPKIDRLREELGPDAERVGFVDMRALGVNPARILPAWLQFVATHDLNGSSPQGLRGIGEPVWPGRDTSELVECEHHESLLNLAFDGGRAWSLRCPYDVDGLDDEVVEAAMRTHPHVVENGVRRVSEAYVDAASAGAPFHGDLAAPPHDALEVAFTDGGELGAIRRLVAERCAIAGLSDERTGAAVTAVNELAGNSIRHGPGGGTLRIWEDDGALVAEVRNPGTISEPLVGRREPPPRQLGGRGIWLANQLCDLVQIRTVPEGTVIRIRVGR